MFFVSRQLYPRLISTAVFAIVGLMAMGQTKMVEHEHDNEPAYERDHDTFTDNPFLALHAAVPMEDFFAESERRVREQLEALRPTAEKEPIRGIQFTPYMIAVNTKLWPQYCAALTAFNLFGIVSDDWAEDNMRKQLLARGFRVADLPHLKLLREDCSEGVSKQAESDFQKKVSAHPFGYLYLPTLEQLEATSVEDMREYMTFQTKALMETQRDRATAFMLKLSTHSQRVMLSYLYERLGMAESGRNYHEPDTNETIAELRQQMIDYLRKQEH